jgi:hypothetical protein
VIISAATDRGIPCGVAATTATECSFGRSLCGYIGYKIADHNDASLCPAKTFT